MFPPSLFLGSKLGVVNIDPTLTPSERGVYGLTRIFAPLSIYDLVVFYAHSVDA
jgi:hypothetical protein